MVSTCLAQSEYSVDNSDDDDDDDNNDDTMPNRL